MRFVISSRRIVLFLTLGLVFLYLATLGSRFLGMVGMRDGTILGTLVEPFDMANNDASVGAWYSSLLLLFCSILLAIIAASKRQLGERYTFHWGFLSGIFLLMSVDEIARLHESFGSALERALAEFADFTPGGFLFFFWVVPGAIFILVVLLAYIRFLADLPRRTLILFVVAGTIYVGGAIGVEMIQAHLTFINTAGPEQVATADNSLSWWMVRLNLEELFEVVGIIVFCYALLSYMDSHAKEITVGVDAR